MLKLSLTPGEYIQIGDNIVVQMYKSTDGRAYLAVQAPRSVPVVRGTLLEEQGAARPKGLLAIPEKPRSRVSSC